MLKKKPRPRWPMGTTCSRGLMKSPVEGSLALTEDGRACIVTSGLEKDGLVFECAVADNVKELFLEQEVSYGSYDYGLIILSPGNTISESTVTDFITFHRHPRYFMPATSSRYGVSAYTEVFEELVRDQKAFKEPYSTIPPLYIKSGTNNETSGR